METEVKVKAKPSELSAFFNKSEESYYVKYYNVKDKEEVARVRQGLDEEVTYTVLMRHKEGIKLKTQVIYPNLRDLEKDLNKKAKPKEEDKIKILSGITVIRQNITYPLYGNKHVTPYGDLVIDGEIGKKICKIKQDNYNDYITYNRNRYYVKNIGRYMSANFIVDEGKTKEYYESKGYIKVII